MICTEHFAANLHRSHMDERLIHKIYETDSGVIKKSVMIAGAIAAILPGWSLINGTVGQPSSQFKQTAFRMRQFIELIEFCGAKSSELIV